MKQQLSDYDFMELQAFARKVRREGFNYAADEYPPQFERDGLAMTTDHATLKALLRDNRDRLNEFMRRDDAVDLHNAHIDAARKRQDDLCLWGARRNDGKVIPCADERTATYFLGMSHFSEGALLRRDVPGGKWAEVRP